MRNKKQLELKPPPVNGGPVLVFYFTDCMLYSRPIETGSYGFIVLTPGV